MNLKIAVLEDKENDYRILESALKIWSEGSGNRIELFWYQTGNEMLKSFEQDGFDILFSDIELEENETGLTFCGRLRELGYSGEIIFLTAFREYVFRGYDVTAAKQARAAAQLWAVLIWPYPAPRSCSHSSASSSALSSTSRSFAS